MKYEFLIENVIYCYQKIQIFLCNADFICLKNTFLLFYESMLNKKKSNVKKKHILQKGN